MAVCMLHNLLHDRRITWICVLQDGLFQNILELCRCYHNNSKHYKGFIHSCWSQHVFQMGYVCIVLQVGLVYETQTTFKKNLHRDTTYPNFELITILYVDYVCTFASLLFLANIKLFKYFSFNKRMSQLNNTLHKVCYPFLTSEVEYFTVLLFQCALDIASFSLMFFIIFLAYAELGYLFFGSYVS